MNNTAKNMGVQISLHGSGLYSSDIYPKGGLLDHMVVLLLVF